MVGYGVWGTGCGVRGVGYGVWGTGVGYGWGDGTGGWAKKRILKNKSQM